MIGYDKNEVIERDMTDEEIKKCIDSSSYETLLYKVRFAPPGYPWFEGEVGEYYNKVMLEKKKHVDHVAISKKIGWERGQV